MRRIACLFVILLSSFCTCTAQVDTEFWFAPPEVTSGHGDGPIYLRISSQDQAAIVNVSQPAKGNLELFSISIAANTTRTINLSTLSGASDIETKPPATVLTTGLKIVSSAPITAYYEVGSGLNGEIFVLKGKNALGNKFIIAGQNYYDNSPDYIPTPYSSFDIVATQDNTVIKVKPTRPIVGHLGESLITIRLNAGETYSFKKPSLLAIDNPIGTIVESSKPIAITIKDDSVVGSPGTCKDLLGDQLIPIAVTGTEYIVLKGSLSIREFFFITATTDHTKIYLSGINTPIRELMAGETYRHDITLAATYITSDKKIYVLHLTGFGCEVGMAVLPPITCTGSRQVSFTRSSSEFFEMNILIKKEGIFDFKLNGSTSLIPASKFIPVPGTNDIWYSAQIPFSNDQVPDGMASLISNNRFSFQAGIINGNGASTCKYWYFSSFNTLFIGDDFSMCEGKTGILDAGPGKESYLWNTGATSQKIEVNQSGTYWVTITTKECVLSDTIRVNVRKGKEDLGPDVELCPGDTAKINGKENFSWQWSDGTIGQYLITTELGKYWINVLDNVGCLASDTINVIRPSDYFDDRITMNLNFVSVDTATQTKINLGWNISDTTSIKHNKVFVHKRVSGSESWNTIGSVPILKNSFQSIDNLTSENIYEYYITLTNPCDRLELSTIIHNTIKLEAVADTATEMINFKWNFYKDWKAGVKYYELWRKLDDIHRYTPLATIPGNQNSYSSKLTTDGFNHQYVIRAIENIGEHESWSNSINFKFENPVEVPNVFTPNDDAFNQTFFIKNIWLYKNSELEIIDRWGKKVFTAIGYQNDWEGEGLSSGVYYYILDLKVNDKILKGPVSLVR